MAEISEPIPSAQSNYRSISGNRSIGLVIVTLLAGAWAIFNGFFVFLVGNYTPVFRTAMGFMIIGVGMMLLGLFDVYVAISVYQFKTNAKGFGIISNIGIIVLNVVFFFVIGLIGLALCVISIIGLAMLGRN